MSAFNQSGNVFLSSPLKDQVFCPNPTTERGFGLVINAHPKEPLIIYPSGKLIVVRHLEDPGASFIYRGHASITTVAKFSPNGYWVASADVSGKVRVWSWDSPEHLLKMESSVFAAKISDLDWDMESKRLVIAGDGSGIIVRCITWDTANNLGEMVGHTKKVNSVSYKPTRPFRVMTASEDMKTCCYVGPPFKLDHSDNSAHSNFVNCVRYSPDGNRCVSVSSDKKIQMYDGKTGLATMDVPNAHSMGIYSVAFSPDSSHFITASADKTVKLWNAETLVCEQTLFMSSDPQINDAQLSVLWTPTGYMISVSLNGNINILNSNSPDAPERTIQAHQVSITALHFDRTTSKLYTGSFDGVICTYDFTAAATVGGVNNKTKTTECIRLVGTDKRHISGGVHAGKVSGICTIDDSVISVGWDDKMRLGSQASRSFSEETGLSGQPCHLASCASTTNLVLVITTAEVSLYRGLIKVTSLSVASSSSSQGGIGYDPTCGALLNEDEVAIGGSDSKTHIYSIVNDSLVEVTTISTRSPVSALAYHPSGEALAIGDDGRQVEVYDRSTWAAKIKNKWSFHSSKITSLSWSFDGAYLASGSLDENIYVWDFTRPEMKLQIPFSHKGGVTGVTWLSADKLASVGNDHAVVTWNIPSSALK